MAERIPVIKNDQFIASFSEMEKREDAERIYSGVKGTFEPGKTYYYRNISDTNTATVFSVIQAPEDTSQP